MKRSSPSSFASKFIQRLRRIDAPQIEQYLTSLVRETDFLRAIFDSLRDAVLVTDAEHRVAFHNETAVGMLGLGGRKVLGQPVRTVLRARVLQEIAEEIEGHSAIIEAREVRVRTPRPRIYEVSVVPVRGTDAAPVTHTVWIISDISDVHRRAAERQQVDSMRSLATLTAGIAHEVKNPLNSLQIHAQLIQKSACSLADAAEDAPGDHPQRQQIDRLCHSSDVLLEEIGRLTRIVDQFIRAVRPVRLHLTPVDPNRVVEAVAGLIEPECAARQIELRRDLEPVPPRILMDAEQIQQALLNIAKNAMEAIDKPQGVITFRTLVKGDHFLFEIEDNGCGIPEKDRLAIFEPYHTTKHEGTGLGLMVVFRIVSAHRGAIGLDSSEGYGTAFKLALPLDERPVRLLEAQTTAEAPPQGPPELEG